MTNLNSPKVIVITGGSSGIGKALVHEFASAGNWVVAGARSFETRESPVAEKFPDGRGEVIRVKTDVTREEDCQRLIQTAIDRYGRLDVLINNAGISMRALFQDVDLTVIRNLMDVNFWGTVYCTKYALPYLLLSKGSLVGVSSIAGYKGLPGRTGYSASKFAMQGFLEVVRIENMKKGLHVLTACPGFTASNIRNVALNKDGQVQKESPLDEASLMTAEAVAARIHKAVKKRKKYLILTTMGKITVWLNRFFPSMMDGMVYNHMAKEANSPFK